MKSIGILILLILSINGFSQDFFWSYPSVGDIIISTTAPNNVGTTDVYSGGMIVDNNPAVTQRGVVVHTSSNPTIATYTKITADATGAGLFSSYVYNLSPSTLYYIRAYAINNAGTEYGEQYTFTTGTSITTPELSTYNISNIAETTASCGGYITSDGGASVTSRGVCWVEKSSGYPTISDDKTTDGTGTGSFTSSLTGLTEGTGYYVRAYATNSAGTSYGNIQEFSTDASIGCPSSVYVYANSIGTTTATLYGAVGFDGGGTVSKRGWVYGKTSEYLDVDIHGNGTKLDDGSGIGLYSEGIASLSSSTQYIVRAYAINEVCVKYSPKYYFTTSTAITVPTVTTDSVNSETATGATLYGNVTATGGASITGRGFEISTSIDFDNPITVPTTGTTGSYNITIDSLKCAGADYYFRAYATNSNGTGYGLIDTLTTSQRGTHIMFTFYESYYDTLSQTSIRFTDDLSDATLACSYIYTHPLKYLVDGYFFPTTNNDSVLDEGTKFYDNSECLLKGTYYFLWKSGSTIYLVTVINGIVTDITNCSIL